MFLALQVFSNRTHLAQMSKYSQTVVLPSASPNISAIGRSSIVNNSNRCSKTASRARMNDKSKPGILGHSDHRVARNPNPMLTFAICLLSTVKSHTEFPRAANAQYIPAFFGVAVETSTLEHHCLRHHGQR